MLRVTITNIDSTYAGIFDTGDEATAINAAIADLIARHKFFEDNVFIPRTAEGSATQRGIMVLSSDVDANDPEAVEEAAGQEDVYLVLVEPLQLGVMTMF